MKQYSKIKNSNIKRSKAVIHTLRSITLDAKRFSYLRKVDPFLFEEVILSAFEALGHTPIRGTRYTGDGGIDGQVIIKNKKYLIQIKRYKGYISWKDVKAFSSICKKMGLNGLFVHTGKTGPRSRKESFSTKVDIVSGERMIALVLGKRFYYKGSIRYHYEVHQKQYIRLLFLFSISLTIYLCFP